jgi:dTDP-4-amino-4,6-dideoxygalactose transaminase
MLFEQHRSIPDLAVFEKIKLETPNISGRMDNLRAAILRPQLSDLSDRVFRWNERYKIIEDGLRNVPIIKIIERAEDEAYVGSSLQFKIPKTNGNQIKAFLNGCMKRGVELKWFGASAPKAFTSKYDSWAYIEPQELVNTDRILSGLIDMRLPLTFSLKDCQIVARIISSEAMKLSKA